MDEGHYHGQPVRVVLVRHGEAFARGEHPGRPLTPRGQEETRRVAARLAGMGLPIEEIRHSGKRRAEETALLLAQAFPGPVPVVRSAGLGPDDPVAPLARELERCPRPLVLVGHLPHLVRLASLLVCGDAEAGVVALPTSGMAVLEKGEGGFRLVALLPPELA